MSTIISKLFIKVIKAIHAKKKTKQKKTEKKQVF